MLNSILISSKQLLILKQDAGNQSFREFSERLTSREITIDPFTINPTLRKYDPLVTSTRNLKLTYIWSNRTIEL